MIVIYLYFLFAGRECSGSLQIQNNKITYWNDGSYITQAIVKTDSLEYDTVIKTETGQVIVIGETEVEYFLGKKLMILHIKKDLQWKRTR